MKSLWSRQVAYESGDRPQDDLHLRGASREPNESFSMCCDVARHVLCVMTLSMNVSIGSTHVKAHNS